MKKVFVSVMVAAAIALSGTISAQDTEKKGTCEKAKTECCKAKKEECTKEKKEECKAKKEECTKEKKADCKKSEEKKCCKSDKK